MSIAFLILTQGLLQYSKLNGDYKLSNTIAIPYLRIRVLSNSKGTYLWGTLKCTIKCACMPCFLCTLLFEILPFDRIPELKFLSR